MLPNDPTHPRVPISLIQIQLKKGKVLEPGPQGTPGVEAAAMNSNQSNNNW